MSKEVNGIHFSINDWMSNLYGEELPRPMNYKWTMDRVERCEKQIWSTSKNIAACGYQVILDFGFTKLAKSKRFNNLAKEENISTQFHYLTAPHSIRRKRVLERNKTKGETFSFEVTPRMFDFMEKEFQKPNEEELTGTVIIDTESEGIIKNDR